MTAGPGALAAAPVLPPVPELASDLDGDATTLREYVAHANAVLITLPDKPDRDPAQQESADGVLRAGRQLRRAFLARHANSVYDALTDGRRRPLRLDELAYGAAERFPGLVPTRDQMAVECSRIQVHKEGLELDQALLLSAILGAPGPGTHLIESGLLPSPATPPGLREQFARTGRVDLPSVELRREGHTAHVTMANTQCLNAEDVGLVASLETAIDLVQLDDEVRVGVLRGAPMTHPRYAGRRVFCAGINLSELRNGGISYLDFMLRRELSCVGKLVHGVLADPRQERTVQKPWLCAVDGFAIGGGMQLAMVCDRVIAERDAYFSLPAAQEGIVPGLANLRLGRLVGARLARRIILGGATVRATGPEAPLICDEVVPPEEMDDRVRRAGEELSAPAVAANRRMLVLAEEPIDGLREYLAEFALVQADRLYSPDVLDKVERRWAARQQRGSLS